MDSYKKYFDKNDDYIKSLWIESLTSKKLFLKKKKHRKPN